MENNEIKELLIENAQDPVSYGIEIENSVLIATSRGEFLDKHLMKGKFKGEMRMVINSFIILALSAMYFDVTPRGNETLLTLLWKNDYVMVDIPPVSLMFVIQALLSAGLVIGFLIAVHQAIVYMTADIRIVVKKPERFNMPKYTMIAIGHIIYILGVMTVKSHIMRFILLLPIFGKGIMSGLNLMAAVSLITSGDQYFIREIMQDVEYRIRNAYLREQNLSEEDLSKLDRAEASEKELLEEVL